MIEESISLYLIHSYAYYIKGTALISDLEYDNITVELKNRWDEVENCNHPHKHLLNFDSIKSSTGYDLEYPNIVKITFNIMLHEKNNQKPKTMNDIF